MNSWIQHLLPPVEPPNPKRPRNLLFGVHEAIPLGANLAIGAQHTVLAIMMVVYTLIAADGIGLSPAAKEHFVSISVMVMAFGTLLQAANTRLGSGHLAVHVPTPVSLGTFIGVTTLFGIEAAAGGMLIAGLVLVVVSRFLPYLRAFFPPEVTGIVVLMLGLSLIEGGATRALGLDKVTGDIDLGSALVAVSTLPVIIAFSVWGTERQRIFAPLIGVVSGYTVAGLSGALDLELAGLNQHMPLLAWPAFNWPEPQLVLAAALPFILVEIISGIDSVGNLLLLDKMNRTDWRRPDMSMVSRGVFAQGLTTIAGGLTATPTTGISSANIGLCFATGITARRVGFIIAPLLFILACMPPVTNLLAVIPQPVMGAILLYTAMHMMVAGMELILSRILNPRRTFTVGLAVIIGSLVILFPALGKHVPEWLHPLTESPLTMSALAAISLNLLFRIGISQRMSLQVSDLSVVSAIREFLEEAGARWAVRPEVMQLAVQGATEVVEILAKQPHDNPAGRLEASFDEFNLRLILTYHGEPLQLTEQSAQDPALHLLQQFAQRVKSGRQGQSAYLQLDFDH